MNQVTKYVNLTASAIVQAGAGVLHGMYVNSTSSGTVKLWDGLAATPTVINNTITPAVGFHFLGDVRFNTGLYAEMGGTSRDITFYIKIADSSV